MGRGPTREELALVRRANRGHRDALDALYRAHRDWVVTLAHRLTHSPDDALDVMQETFVYLFARFPGFRLRASMRSFLYPVVKHIAVDVMRRRAKVVDLDAYRRDGTLGDRLSWHVAAGAPGAELVRMTAALPVAQQELLWLRFGLDFRLAEIADALDIPLGTVKSRLHNALESLRTRLAEPDDDKTSPSG